MNVKPLQHVPQERLITLYARPCELPALHAAVEFHIRLLEQYADPSEVREQMIETLRGFEHRYEAQLREFRESRKRTSPRSLLIEVSATMEELLAFGSAVLLYVGHWESTGRMVGIRRKTLNPIFAFQQRYIDSLPTHP